jgi:hypothetical protein
MPVVRIPAVGQALRTPEMPLLLRCTIIGEEKCTLQERAVLPTAEQTVARAFSSEVDTGSREDASKQKIRARF